MNTGIKLNELTSSIIGASESLDLILGSGFAPDFFTAHSDLFHLVDIRIPRRCLLYDPAINMPHLHTNGGFIRFLHDNGWETRIIDQPPSLSCLIVDGCEFQLWKFEGGLISEPRAPTTLHDKELLHALQSHFNLLWHGKPNEKLLYEDLLSSSLPDKEKLITSIADDHWNRIIKELAADPKALYKIDPLKFEELVAELLLREGLEVEVTLPSKDGGRDILALEKTSTGSHLYLVECKRYAKHRPITVDIVRALYGVVEEEKATGGLLVTTSHFTADAWKFREKISYRMGLRDYDALTQWLKRHAK